MLKMFQNNKKFSKFLFLALAAFSALTFSGCKKDKKHAAEAILQSENEGIPVKLRKLSPETQAYIEGKSIIVVLGYGYNDIEHITKISQTLDTNFGLESEDKAGLISILVYPADFMVAGKERISSLVDAVQDRNLAGMVIMGAPEGLHIALSKIQDKAEGGKIPYPIFTFFSQDDVLGTESTSDFVLDYAHKTNTIEGEVTDFIPDFDANLILTNAISEMIELRAPLKADKNLQGFVQKLLEKNRTVIRYIDGETGLQSINHFIFE